MAQFHASLDLDKKNDIKKTYLIKLVSAVAMAAAGVEKKAWSPLAIIMFKAREPKIAFPVRYKKRRFFTSLIFPFSWREEGNSKTDFFSITFCVTFALSSLLFSFFSPFVV